MSVPSSDINNIVDFLMKKDDRSYYLDASMRTSQCMAAGFPADVPDNFLNDTWPSSSDELLENIFSLDGGLLDMPPAAASLAGSDSGLSMDHADLDLMDQPFPVEDFLMPLSSPSPPSTSSPASSSGLGSEEDLEEQLDFTSCLTLPPSSHSSSLDAVQPPHVLHTPAPALTFQNNTNNLKRKSPSSPSAVIVPKIQKHYISKREVAAPNKHKVILNNAPLHNNIQIVNHGSAATIQSGDVSTTQKKLIRVAGTGAGNPRSILLPVTIKDMKELRSIKIINATDLKNPSNLKIAAANFLQKSKKAMENKRNNFVLATAAYDADDHQYVMEDSTSDRGSGHSDEDDDDDESHRVGSGGMGGAGGQFPRLELNAEERRLLAKEGIQLPQSYPLTRMEERELKRIRRKIRNKISAQDSRRRKKEYVDGLEDRVKQCTEENQSLMKKIKALQSQNHSLATQLKKLQSLVSKGGYKSAQPATCLMVLLLSVALVVAPSLRAGPPPSSPLHSSTTLLSSIRRALLSANTSPQQHSTNTVSVMGSDDSVDEDFSMEELVSFGQPMSEHDYHPIGAPSVPPVGHYTTQGYMDVALDEGDTWPPNKQKLPEEYPIKLEKLEYDPDYDGSQLFLANHEEVDSSEHIDIKDETLQMYNAAMEKLEMLASADGMAEVTGKIGEFLDMTPQVWKPNSAANIENQLKKNFTGTRSVVLAKTMSPIELQ